MSLLLALQVAGGPVNYADSLSVGNYVVSGKTITDSVGRVDALSVGAYAVSGKTITDSVARFDSLSVGNYVVSGKDITDVVTSGPITYADNLSVGNYTVSGISITDLIARNDSLSVGNYAVTGGDLTDDLVHAISSSGISSGGGMTGWDGKIYHSPEKIKPLGYKRTYFPDTQVRPIQEAQEVIEKLKTKDFDYKVQIFNEASDVVEQLKSEITKLQCMEGELSQFGREVEGIKAKLAIEQMRAQIEEIDVIFVMMVISSQTH
jgi:hypothetical protein